MVHLDPKLKIINGLLHLDRTDVPLNWNDKIKNPQLVIVREEEFFVTLLICDVAVKHQNRAKGKNEHIGLLPIDNINHLGVPIDNEASLEDLESQIEEQWIEAFFPADFVRTRELLEQKLNKLKEVPVLTI